MAVTSNIEMTIWMIGKMILRICRGRVALVWVHVKRSRACYTRVMLNTGKPWYTRKWGIGLICIGACVCAYLFYFVYLVGTYAYQYKTRGVDTVNTELKRKEMQTNVSRMFATGSPQGDIDTSRIEPKNSVPTLGNPQAKVRIVEFLDYGCPFCYQVEPVIQRYISQHPQDVLLMIRDLPIIDLHPGAKDTAIAAQCIWKQGDAKRFWRYHALLFANQGKQDAAALRTYAQTVGANIRQFEICVASKQPEAEIDRSIEDAVALGLAGTPSFFFNGVRVQGAMDDETFALLVQEAAKKVK